MKEQIIYHPDDIVRLIDQRLDEVRPFAYDGRCRELLGEGFVRRIMAWERTIREQRDNPFTIVFCGEFKRGKSSLINALLGEYVAPTDVTTETVTLNRISYGPHANEAVLSGGRRVVLTDSELARDSLQAVADRLGEPIRQVEIRRPIEALRRITIVDTPGLGDALADFSELVEAALRQADAVVYVSSVTAPLAQTEQLFLKAEVLPQKYTELFVVANYSDVLEDSAALTRMQGYFRQKMESLLPGLEPLLLSSLDETCRLQGLERPNAELAELLQQHFSGFRQRLNDMIEQKRYMVIPDRMQRLTRQMADELGGMLDTMERGAALDAGDVAAMVADMREKSAAQAAALTGLRETLGEEIRGMGGETRIWVGELLDHMEQELDRLGEIPADDFRKYYSFYCIDTVQNALNSCLAYHREQLFDRLEEISGDMARALTGGDDAAYDFRFALNNQTWTRGDTFGYVMSQLGLGGLSLITDSVAGMLRHREMAGKAPDILRMIREQFSGFRVSVDKCITDIYKKLTEQVLRQLDAHSEAQLAAVRESQEQTEQVARLDKEKKEEIRQLIGRVRASLDGLTRFED